MDLLGIFIFIVASSATGDVWEQDLSDMAIGPTTDGYDRVDLKCAAEHMEVSIHMEEDFSGVIYTRGSYADKKLPCFRDLKSGKYFRMNIPFDSCNTSNVNNVYTNILVVQHDDDLIMPGDAAFTLECDFSKPKNVPLHTSMTTEVFDIVSKITLADADPGGKPIPELEKLRVFNKSDSVSFQPKILLRSKDEL